MEALAGSGTEWGDQMAYLEERQVRPMPQRKRDHIVGAVTPERVVCPCILTVPTNNGEAVYAYTISTTR